MGGLAEDETIAGTGQLESPATPAPPAPATPPTPASPREAAGGSRIGRYEIVRLLGRGGMGAVYQAFDPVLERAVALKVMLPGAAADPEHKQRFEREARAVARLSHPGVVILFDLGYHTDGSPYIVMELLKGRDLLARLGATPPLALTERITIVTQVLDGLGHAHKAGIVHRDIKPANVFLTEEGSAKIMDFGIASWMSSGGTSRTVIGTAGYMSPEQVRGERVDGRSDLFSVGSLLCELATGRRPFDAETPVATFYRIARGEANIELPPGPEYAALLPVLRRALAPVAEERYATAGDFAEALRSCTTVAPSEGARTAPPARADSPSLDASPAMATPVKRPVPAPGLVREAPARRADPSGLFRLLREIYVGGKSGHLHLAVARERKSLRFLRGQILHGTSDAAGEHMGDILVRYGLLSQADLERAVAIVLRERRRLGSVLGELGLLERGRIEEAIGLHAREILFNVIGRADVSCTFEDMAESSLETDLVCPLSTGQLILEATRRILEPELVRTVLGDLGRVLVLSPDPLLRTQKITLTPADGFMLSRVDGSSSARDVMALVPLPVEDAERSLFSLLCTGIVGYRQETNPGTRPAARATSRPTPPAARVLAPPPTTATPTTAPAAPPVPPPVPAIGGPSPAPAEPGVRPRAARSVEEARALILETHAKIKRDHFEVMGLERTATEAEVREAYVGFARVLHPDACQDPAFADLREKREAVFIRLSEAYETLRDPASRAAYERAFEPSKLRSPGAPMMVSRWTRDPVPSSSPATPPPPAAPDARSPSAIDKRLWPETILGVAERHFEDGQYWEAIQQLEPMLKRAEGPTFARASMLLAQAYMKNPKWKKRAERVLQSLLDENPGDIAACLALAELYRDAQLPARAKSLYRRVLDIQPLRAEASQALAELEQQGEPAPQRAGLSGLFKRR